MKKSHFYLFLFLPLLVVIAFAPWSADLDLKISNYFFQNHFDNSPLYEFVYNYAIYPAWFCILLAFIGYLVSFRPSYRSWRKASLFLLATLAIGSGLIIHLVLKDHWGRPRPKQVVEFNGTQSFIPFYEPNFSNPIPSKSFPCGHCSMGFYFFGLALLGWYYNKKAIFYLGIFLSFFLGILLSYVRMAQGGHFLSDVIISGVIMWLTSLILFFWLFEHSSTTKKVTK